MDIALGRFNLYFLLAVAVLLGGGCKTGKSKKLETTLRIHVEASEDSSFTRKIKAYKDESVSLRVHETPLLTHLDIVDAQVVETLGGFALQLKTTPMGRWQLDKHTSINIGRHYAVYVLYGDKPAVSRWIAVPIISNRISNGIILFTPDATREEAELIVKGLPREGDKKKSTDRFVGDGL